MLPRLKRFADVLVGEKREGKALLRRALQRMLAEHHRYQRGTPLDRFAFTEIYRLWLGELRDHADLLRQAKSSEEDFDRIFPKDRGADFDTFTATFLGQLPPQQRSTLLLVYGEGFDYEGAAKVLDSDADTISGAPDPGECKPCRSLEPGLAGAGESERHHRDSLSGRGTGIPP